MLDVDEATALASRRITRDLRVRGQLIGTNHRWIAATGVRYAVPLVTANVSTFRRVEALDVIGYR
jgi:predicted nucleic acid-binding protein